MYIHLYLITCLKSCICIYKNDITHNFDVTYICILGWWPCITNVNIAIINVPAYTGHVYKRRVFLLTYMSNLLIITMCSFLVILNRSCVSSNRYTQGCKP